MRRRLPVALGLAACLAAAALLAGTPAGSAKAPPRPPKGFFGISPQSGVTHEDAVYMKAGGIETLRWPMIWAGIQPTRKGGYQWGAFDPVVEIAARHGLRVLPFILTTPRWLANKETTLPIDSAKARSAWKAFLRAAVKRYGPGGSFWSEHPPGQQGPQVEGTVEYEPAIPRPLPIRTWQVWNEANFHYFTYPVSPQRYARLLRISTPAIKGADPGAKVVLTGLFGDPTASGPRGMPAAEFLEDLYRVPGIKGLFDGIALHPYAADAKTLEELVEGLHAVTQENHDPVSLYVTEMGWGSQNDPNVVSFEQGIRGQVRQMRGAYGYLLRNQRRLHLKEVYWYSWKDLTGSCSFCDSVGLFHDGKGLRAKPAWHAFVSITRGRARP